VYVEGRRAGLALLAEFDSGVPKYGGLSGVLLLRWIELVIIAALAVSAWLVVEKRHEIAATWLFAHWAPAHQSEAANLLAAMVLLLGGVAAHWKRRQLFTYSVIEIVFGTLSAAAIGRTMFGAVSVGSWLGVASALYVISRGFGNLADALLKEVGVIERVKLEPLREQE
jgi:hypothetical protein